MTISHEGARYLEAQAQGFERGSVKVHVDLGKESLFGLAGESLWATPTDTPGHFLIDNVPFFTAEPTYGDVVRAQPSPPVQAHFFEYDEVVTRGPWTWFCVGVDAGTDTEPVRLMIREAIPSQDELKIETGMGIIAGVYLESAADAVHRVLEEIETKGLAAFVLHFAPDTA
jgi:hypothetical protein